MSNTFCTKKISEQAADAVIQDYDDTLEVLERVAGSLKNVDNPRLAKLGYKRINFQRHNFFSYTELRGILQLWMECIPNCRTRMGL